MLKDMAFRRWLASSSETFTQVAASGERTSNRQRLEDAEQMIVMRWIKDVRPICGDQDVSSFDRQAVGTH